MHIERLLVAVDGNEPGQTWDFRSGRDSIRKWTVLPREPDSKLMTHCLALACVGRKHASELNRRFPPHELTGGKPLQVEAVLARHAPMECSPTKPVRKLCGLVASSAGIIEKLRPDLFKLQEASLGQCQFHKGSENGGWLILGYGPRILTHDGTDIFDFSDPHHRLRRVASVFDAGARLTDPLAFLRWLSYKGVRHVRPRSRDFLSRLNRELACLLDISPEAWMERDHDFSPAWRRLGNEAMVAASIILDIARHALDAAVRCADPFEMPGIVLFNGIEQLRSPLQVSRFLELLDSLFPNLQFLVRGPLVRRFAVPDRLLQKSLRVATTVPLPRQANKPRLPPGAVLLIDVDSTLPNLALMKLSRHFKNQNRKVTLARRKADFERVNEVFASCVFAFPTSAVKVERLRKKFGSALQLGGSGVDIKLRLSPEIENLPADYSLYPELGDRALGFLTRGCPLHCPFCIVPIKEGKPKVVSDLDSLIAGNRKKLILLDDNILSHPAAVGLMEEMLRRDLQVNFNQTLDVRMLTSETASLLRRIRCSNVNFTRPNYYFSLNDTRGLEVVRRKYEMLQMDSKSNVEFVCMYGFNTTLKQDVERFRFLRSLPGAYVFTQRYRPVLGGPEANLRNFFDDDADEQLDVLVKLIFSQNMKSMEVYYRWLCLEYARQKQRLHSGLLNTLFRYNGRHRMGGFIEKLKLICQQEAATT